MPVFRDDGDGAHARGPSCGQPGTAWGTNTFLCVLSCRALCGSWRHAVGRSGKKAAQVGATTLCSAPSIVSQLAGEQSHGPHGSGTSSPLAPPDLTALEVRESMVALLCLSSPSAASRMCTDDAGGSPPGSLRSSSVQAPRSAVARSFVVGDSEAEDDDELATGAPPEPQFSESRQPLASQEDLGAGDSGITPSAHSYCLDRSCSLSSSRSTVSWSEGAHRLGLCCGAQERACPSSLSNFATALGHGAAASPLEGMPGDEALPISLLEALDAHLSHSLTVDELLGEQREQHRDCTPCSSSPHGPPTKCRDHRRLSSPARPGERLGRALPTGACGAQPRSRLNSACASECVPHAPHLARCRCKKC